MFTVKIVNEGQDNTQLFEWPAVRSHGPLSPQFEIIRQDAIDRAEDEDVEYACRSYYAYICDNSGNEYWLTIGEDCFVTDSSGKTVMIHRSPQPIGGVEGWHEAETNEETK